MMDRVDTGFYECDDEGYWMATDEAGEDGFAKGVYFSLYVPYPWTLAEGVDNPFTDEHQQEFCRWIQERYPNVDWDFSTDDEATAEFYGEYREGEDNTELALRITVDNPDYVRLRNEGCIYYNLRDDFARHCDIDPDKFYIF